MPTIAEVRQRYPQYNDMSDADLAGALHQKFYSDMPREQFDAKIGLGPAPSDEQQGPQAPAMALRPFASLGGNYDQARQEAQNLMGSGLEDLRTPTGGDLAGSVASTIKGIAKLGAGGLGYVTSPISGALRSIVGTPGEEALGIPKEISETVAGAALPIPKRIPLPNMARSAERVGAEAPSVQALKEAYVTAKESPEVAAVQIKPEAAARNADITKAELNKEWLDPNLAPKTHYILDKLQNPPEGATVTMANVDSARRLLGRMAGRGDEEAAAASIAKKKLDEWVGGVGQADVLAGNPALAQGIMQEGRQNYAAGKLGEALDARIAKAELQAGGTYSGLNQQNAIRQKVAQFLNSDESRGLNLTQRAAAEEVVKGTAPENVTRFVANMLGGGGGLGIPGTAAAGHLIAGPAGMAAPAIGFGLNRLGAVMKGRQAERLSELIRSESPLGKQLAGPVEDFSKAAQAAEVSPTARNLSRLTIASRNLSNNLKDADIHIAPNDIMKSLFGKPAGADEPQRAGPMLPFRPGEQMDNLMASVNGPQGYPDFRWVNPAGVDAFLASGPMSSNIEDRRREADSYDAQAAQVRRRAGR